MILRDIEFNGPYGPEGLPDEPGVYLVCTESSGGIRILGVYEGDDMRSHASTNPRSPEWKDHEDNNGIFFYGSGTIRDRDARVSKVLDIIDTRPYDVPCVDRIADDW
ncbi:MAG: hypothetical protein ACI4Q9_05165 [Candidatus Methanomethylophilaceae archaeon]